jgi:hypothetical protein
MTYVPAVVKVTTAGLKAGITPAQFDSGKPACPRSLFATLQPVAGKIV